jgi:hypothetical protein
MRYTVTRLDTVVGNFFQVWGSADGGNTFTELDAANRATSGAASQLDVAASGYYKQNSAFFLFQILNGATGFRRCIKFNLSSGGGSWGAYTPDSPLSSAGKAWVTWRPNGDILLIGYDPAILGGNQAVVFTVFNGTSWSSLMPVMNGTPRTDIVLSGGSGLLASSASQPFTAEDSGQVLIIAGGSGFTPGQYTISSVGGGLATLAAAPGPDGSTGGAGYVQMYVGNIATIVMDDASGTCTIAENQGGPARTVVVGIKSDNSLTPFLSANTTQVPRNSVTNSCIFKGKAYFGVHTNSAEALVMSTDSASNPAALSYVLIQDQTYLDGTSDTMKIFPSLDGSTLYAMWGVYDTRSMANPPYKNSDEGSSLAYSGSADGMTWSATSIYFQPPLTDPYQIGQYPAVTSNADGGGDTAFLATASDLGGGIFGATEWKFYGDAGNGGSANTGEAQYNLANNSGVNAFKLIKTGGSAPPVAVDYANLSLAPIMSGDVGTATLAQRTQSKLFQIGGKLYAVAQVGGSSPYYCHVYASYGGDSWAALDPTHAPQPGLPNQGVAVQVVGTVIYLLWLNPGLTVTAIDVSAGTPLWSTVTAYSGIGGTIGAFDFHAPGAGAFNVVYGVDISGTFSLQFVQYSGGSWGSSTAIGTDVTNPELTGYFVDPVANTAHLTYSQRMNAATSPVSPNVVRHLSISASGTVSASDVVIADALQYSSSGNNFTYPSFGYGCTFGGQQAWPFAMRTSAGIVPAIAVGSGGSYTVTQLGPLGTDQIYGTGGAWTYALAVDGVLYALWANNYTDVITSTTVAQIRMSYLTGGTFGAPITLYDIRLQPPLDFTAPTIPNQQLYNLSAFGSTTGGLAATFSMADNATPTPNIVSVYAFLGGVPWPFSVEYLCNGWPVPFDYPVVTRLASGYVGNNLATNVAHVT